MDILANFEASGVVDFFILILYYVASGEIAVFQSDEEGKVF
jgi:CRP-like cAMP-binding protein